jgi:hypothetical protein
LLIVSGARLDGRVDLDGRELLDRVASRNEALDVRVDLVFKPSVDASASAGFYRSRKSFGLDEAVPVLTRISDSAVTKIFVV